MAFWNAYLVLGFGIIILLYWLFLLSWPAWNTLKKWSQLKAIAAGGRDIYGQISESSYLKTPAPGKPAPIEIQVEFENFAGSRVQQQFRFMDTRPQERRYEKGKSIALKMAEFPEPAVILAEGKAAFRPLFWIIWLSVLGGVAFGIYYLLKPFIARVDSWNSLLMLLDSVELIPMLGGLGIGAVITLVVIGTFLRSFSGQNNHRLKFFGVRATATIQSRRETGVYVNRQPQIEYQYSFQDRNGQERLGLDREVVSYVQLTDSGPSTTREIMYMPDSPEQSSFMSNIAGPSAARIILKLVLYFVFLIFSIVIGGTIISQLGV